MPAALTTSGKRTRKSCATCQRSALRKIPAKGLAKDGCGFRNRRSNRCRIRTVRDVQLCGDQLVRENQAGVGISAAPDRRLQNFQQFCPGVGLLPEWMG